LANVYLVGHTSTKHQHNHNKNKNKTYALKVFDKLHCYEHSAGFDAVKSLNREAQVLCLMKNTDHAASDSDSHPFILQMHQSWQDKINVFFLVPFLPGGELSKRLYDYTNNTTTTTTTTPDDDAAAVDGVKKGLPVDHARFYSACLAEAIRHMHQRNIAYRDLKPDNVMLDREGYCVLIDLGFTKVLDPENGSQTYTMCGTPGYVAPEQLASGNRGCGRAPKSHTKMVDWWSFAVVLYELLANATPFQCPGMDDYATQDAIMIADYQCPDFFPPSAKNLIDQLLVVDVTQRLGYAIESTNSMSNHAQILNHEWFHHHDNDNDTTKETRIDFDKLRRKQLMAPWIPELEHDKDTSHFYTYDEREVSYHPYRSLTEQEQQDFEQFDWRETTIMS
jgi:serine/threonine protein kinase